MPKTAGRTFAGGVAPGLQAACVAILHRPSPVQNPADHAVAPVSCVDMPCGGGCATGVLGAGRTTRRLCRPRARPGRGGAGAAFLLWRAAVALHARREATASAVPEAVVLGCSALEDAGRRAA